MTQKCSRKLPIVFICDSMGRSEIWGLIPLVVRKVKLPSTVPRVAIFATNHPNFILTHAITYTHAMCSCIIKDDIYPAQVSM